MTATSSLRAREVEAASGWRVVAFARLASTNEEAARHRDEGADRLVVVADAQTAGRGRGGHRFASPVGGLYASLVLRVPSADLPGPLVLATAVALAEAVETVAGVRDVALKWPNDVWVGGRKVAGILLEAAAAAGPAALVPVVVGVGVNVDAVPADLPADVADATTALAHHADRSVGREALLSALLVAVDRHVASLRTPAGRARVEDAYRARLALRGRRVRFLVGDAVVEGVLRDAALDRGLLVEPPGGVPAWWAAAHVRELRPAPP